MLLKSQTTRLNIKNTFRKPTEVLVAHVLISLGIK